MSNHTLLMAAVLTLCFSMQSTHSVAESVPLTGSAQPSISETSSDPEELLLNAVGRCWNVDPGSVAATLTIQVGFSLTREGLVENNEVRLLSSDGEGRAEEMAFEAARRAILRCQSGGYQMPSDEYGQWKDVVVTFAPE